MAVVENLEDMWKVTKLQQERKRRLEEQAARQEMGQLKAEAAYSAKVRDLLGLHAKLAGRCACPKHTQGLALLIQ